MTQEERQLLFKDLSARLHHGVKVSFQGQICTIDTVSCDATLLLKGKDGYVPNIEEGLFIDIDRIKPYLRPMSSMTDEEKKEYASFIGGQKPFDSDFSAYPKEYGFVYEWDVANYVNWLNSHHFDYRGLIEKGLAIEVTEVNNPYK